MGKSQDAPTPPDYMSLAIKQGEINKDAALYNAGLAHVNQSNPYGSIQFNTGKDAAGNPTTNMETTLNPTQQALMDKLNKVRSGVATNTNTGVGVVDKYIQQNAGWGDMFKGAPKVSTPGLPTAQGVDPNQGPALNQGEDARKAMVDAVYKQYTSQLDPRFQAEERNQKNEMIQQGLTEGSEAYRTQLGDFRRSRDQAYQGAGNQAVIQGDASQNQAYNQSLGARAQAFGQGLSSNSQLYNQQLLGQNQAHSQSVNSRDQAIREIMQQRGMVQSDYQNYLGNISPVIPGYSSVAGGGGAAAADVAGAGNNAYNAAIQAANVNNANSSSTTSGLLGLGGIAANAGLFDGLGGAIMGLFSDRRLKSDIRKIGSFPSGLAIYSYNIFGKPSIGVMADEVAKIFPGAVGMHSSGYAMVNYDKVA